MKLEKLKKALKDVNDEIRSLELAPTINGCEMTEDWKEMLEINRTIKEVLEKEFKHIDMMVEPEEYVKISDLLAYCEQTAKICENLREMSAYYNITENTPTRRIVDFAVAEEYFGKEFCKWTFDVPNMIKAVASGEWKAEVKNNEKTDG